MRLKPIVIAIIASMLLLTPSASASDHRLGIFGNANEDDTIDLKDVEYTAPSFWDLMIKHNLQMQSTTARSMSLM